MTAERAAHITRAEPRVTGTRRARSGLAVVGTGSGVGKTVIASALIAAMRTAGARVAPMKPVSTGGGADAERLRAAAAVPYPTRLVAPLAFHEAVSPLVAARRAHAPIDVGILDSAFEELRSSSDLVVVEGGGGLMVPITESESFATLLRRWDLPLVLVVPNDAESVNQALLTVQSAVAHNLELIAVVLNDVTDVRAGTAERTNQAVLKELLRSVPVVRFPHAEAVDNFAHLAILARELSPHVEILRRT